MIINLHVHCSSFLCSFLQGVDTLHSLTDGKLLTAKLKETKKSLDSMWIKSFKFRSVLSGSLPKDFNFLYMFFIDSSRPLILKL